MNYYVTHLKIMSYYVLPILKRTVELNSGNRNQESNCFYVCRKSNFIGNKHRGTFKGDRKFQMLSGVVT